MRFRTMILQSDKTATGIEVPPAVVEQLGAGKRPPVRVTINGFTYRSTIAVMGGVFMVGVSAENRAGAGVKRRRRGRRRHRARHRAAHGRRAAGARGGAGRRSGGEARRSRSCRRRTRAAPVSQVHRDQATRRPASGASRSRSPRCTPASPA